MNQTKGLLLRCVVIWLTARTYLKFETWKLTAYWI